MNCFYKGKCLKPLSLFLALNIFTQAVFPMFAYALTSGPSQPEVQSFEPVGTTEMVDLFSGDFNYNIPLFELPGPNGGYPFNMVYNSGITMDQEASWVGLGWNINPGAITRQMRGIPDEFDGDLVKKTMNIKPNVTLGTGVGTTIEVFGGDVSIGSSYGITIFYNNYKGVGYSLDRGMTIGMSNKSGNTANLGLDVSLNSQDGMSANASLSLADKANNETAKFNVGVGYDSRSGLNNVSAALKYSKFNVSSSYSAFNQGYTPQVAMEMRGTNINTVFKLGGAFMGLAGHPYFKGFFSTQYLKDRGEEVSAPAYGFLNLEKAGANAVMDYNREKDGVLKKNSPNLAIPNLTNDIYTATGHGVAGTFRPFRNDVPRLFDQNVTSKTLGGSIGVDVNLGYGPAVGVDVTVNYSQNESRMWTQENENPLTSFNHSSQSNSPLDEPYVFKNYGEHTSDINNELAYLGGDEPVAMQLEPTTDFPDKSWKVNNKYVKKDGAEALINLSNKDNTREPRNSVMQFVNGEKKGGMEVLNPDGSRYIYNVVAQNTKQVECQFSTGAQSGAVCSPTVSMNVSGSTPKYDHANTDEFYSKTELPGYAYAYLISGIKGADYVDVTQDGISSDDLGYWVKFEYEVVQGYQWRTPFEEAQYMRGLHTTFQDDKGSYVYGTKDVYYLKQVETKTHIAKFYTSPRKDGFGVSNELQKSGNPLGLALRKLDKIELKSVNDATPIKTINFAYNYKLCKGIPNHSDRNISGANNGKLTLEKVWFTYGNNNRGTLSPYVFSYNEANAAENPNYNGYLYDRWSNYKPIDGNVSNAACNSIENPYVDQYNYYNPEDPNFKSNMDRNMSVWNLKSIKLPSGAQIDVQYEADDYAYVQNKRAAQMFRIASLAPGLTSENHIDHQRWADGAHRRLYFVLEKPLIQLQNNNDDEQSRTAEIEKYTKGLDRIYFKAYMNIRKNTDNRKDYVSGYADIDAKGIDLSSVVNGKYTRGWIEMGRPRIGKKNGARNSPYHNFSLAAWQYIRTEQPQLAGFGPFDTDPDASKSAIIDKTKSLVSIFPTILQTFSGFDLYAHKNNWGEYVELERSYIRLNSPDKKKIGGGVRVKQIALKDSWDAVTGEEKGVYGQVYDYTMKEGQAIISSGVASYEPALGGDENPLRVAKEYPDAIPLKTNNNLYFEYPVNESYYPGASVGYRKVTVTSLATYYAKALEDDGVTARVDPFNIPSGIKTTGASVHEFYTAKDFPVITDETPINLKPFDLFVPIPLIGQITVNNLTASQGYSTIINDMHGKPKSISQYEQDKNGVLNTSSPINSIQYNYKCKKIYVDGTEENDYYVLDNSEFRVLTKEGKDGLAVIKENQTLGTDYEVFTDMREMEVESNVGGVAVNTDVIVIIFATIPAFVPWPSIGRSTNKVRTSVLNKIVHKSGILVEVIASDGNSKVSTQNYLFDETGEAVITKTFNEFNDPIYSYNVPAHVIYEGMGMAYKNIGLSFEASTSIIDPTGKTTLPVPAEYKALLVPGDEFYGSPVVNPALPDVSATFIKNDNGNAIFSLKNASAGVSYKYTLIRSGRRNILQAKAGNITSLSDPTIRE